jgi:hypothetical protein
MKKSFILSALLLSFINSNAQDNKLENNQFKINILSPGLTYEKRTGNLTSLASNLNLSAGFAYDSDSGTTLLLSPYIREELRYYYNFEKRNAKNKSTRNNSANFIALTGSYYFKPISNSEYVSLYDGVTIAPVWGLQRTYRSGINFNIIGGAGYNFGTNDRTANFVPVINFTLGWVIGK